MLAPLRSQRFRQFALAKLLSLTGQNALVYAVFILVIEREASSFATSVYVVAAIVPSVILSVPGGLVADSLPRKLVLLVVGLLRAAVVGAFLVQGLTLGTVIVLTLVLWSVWQFYTPAENGALPAVIDREALGGANATLQVVSILSQLVGAGFLAPIGLKVLPTDAVFAVCLALILAATLLYATIRALTPEDARVRASGGVLAGASMLRNDPVALQASLLLALVASALLVVIVVVPEFLTDVLRTSPGNAVYIFSPAAGGLAIGLALAPGFIRVLGSRPTALLGYVLFASCLVALGAVDHLARFWEETLNVPLDELEDRLKISRLVASTLLAVPVGGLGLAFVNVGARTVLYERAPPGGIGQLLAAQSALGSLIGVAPTLLAGLVVDRLQVDIVLFALSGILIALGVLQVTRGGTAPSEAQPAPA